MNLPYDILYKIYMMIDDYPTIINFYILNKSFYYDYIQRYNKFYKHRFNILFKEIFSFLSLLPHHRKDQDVKIFTCIQTQCIEPVLKPMVNKDIIFLYTLYKKSIYEEATKKLGFNLAQDLTNIILIQGPTHINKNSKIILNKNKVKLIIPNESRMLELSIALNFLYLRIKFQMLEDFSI
jgi:hypothetical protein